MSRRVVGNAVSVMAAQLGSYALPLVTVPYLLRVIGPEHYGLIAFSQAVMAYFVTLVNYGFNLSATRELAVRRDDRALRSELFSTVITIKLGLCALSLAVLGLLIHFLPRFHQDAPVFLASFGTVIGMTLYPVWFFRGIEKLYLISAVNITANLIFTVSIFIFVRHSSDYLIAAILQAAGQIVAGVLALVLLFARERVRLVIPTAGQLRHRLVDGWYLFMSTAAATLYTSSNAVVLGFVCGMTQVGYYSAAYKIFAAGQGLVAPMCQAIYPHVCSLAHRSGELAISYLRKAMVVIGGLTFVGGAAVILFAHPIVRVAMGSKYLASVPVLELMAMTPFACALNNIYGTQGMLNFGMKAQYSRIIIASAFFNNMILIPLCLWFKAPGAAVAGLITETVVTIMMGLALQSRGVDLLPRPSDFRAPFINLSVVAQRSVGRVRGWSLD